MAFDPTTSNSYNSLISKVPSALKITNFWPQYIEALAEELDLEDEELIIPSKIINDPSSGLNDYLIYLSTKYGYTPNLILDNSIDFLQKEVESIPYRIRHKGTYKGYKFNFKQIGRLGEIYNFFYNESKLVKAINWSTVYSGINLLTASGLSIPFTGLKPDINYSTVTQAELIQLDTNRYLDETPPWVLDNYLYSVPSKHLGIEYYIDRLVTKSGISTEYSIYDDYLQYIDIGTDYNKRNVVFPHTGTNICMFTSTSGTYNGFGYTTTSAYSIPEIKLSSTVTLPYLLTYSGNNPTSTDICYASVGTKIRGINSNNNRELINSSGILLAYSFDNSDYSNFIQDYSINDISTTISGTTKKINSILGKSVNFNNSTYCEGYNFTLPASNNSIYFWFNTSSYSVANRNYGTLFSISGLYSMQYDYINFQLTYEFNGTTISTISGVLPNTDYLLCIENNYSLLSSNLYLNGNLVASGNYSSYTASSKSINIGTNINKDVSSIYVGQLDSFIIYNSLLSVSTLQSAYTNRLGLITSVSNPVYRVSVKPIENNYDNPNWFSIQTTFPTNSINEEYLFTLSSGITNYSGILNYSNLIEKYLQIKYYTQNGDVIIENIANDNGSGTIIGDYVSGTINYTTGTYLIYPYVLNKIYSKTLATNFVPSILNQFLNYNVQPGTFYIYYNITTTSYVAMDNGSGTIIGTGISSGTIDYTTGELNVTFTQTTQSGYPITCQYDYKTVLAISNSKPYVEAEYKVYDDIDITEVAFENSDKVALTYASFPPINSYSMYNYMSFANMIRLTTIS